MANRYWVAASGGNWSDTANWSDTSGGAGGASVPTVGDNAYFDSGGLGNVTLDANATVDTFRSYAGYTGYISLGSANLTCSTFILDHGAGINFGSGYHMFTGSTWDIEQCGTPNFSTSTCEFAGTFSDQILWSSTATSNFFDNVVVSGSVSWTDIAYRSLRTNYLEVTSTGTINATGGKGRELRIYDELRNSGTISGLNAYFYFSGGSAGVTLNEGMISIRLWLNVDVTLNPFPVAAGQYSMINLETENGSSDAIFELGAGNFVIGDITTTSQPVSLRIDASVNNPDIEITGDVTDATGDLAWTKGTGTITLTGTDAQSLNFNSQSIEGIDVLKTGGSVTLTGDVTTDFLCDCNGLVDLNGFTLTALGSCPYSCGGSVLRLVNGGLFYPGIINGGLVS